MKNKMGQFALSGTSVTLLLLRHGQGQNFSPWCELVLIAPEHM